VIVPHIRSAREAEDIVLAAKFPPMGNRGYSSLCLSGRWGIGGADDGLEWMEWSRYETLVIPMVEEPEAVENITEIVSIEGVDGVFFGAADFSVASGVPLQTGHPIVQEAICKTVAAARERGKFVICIAKYPWWDDARRLISLGVKAVEVGHDVSILASIWKKTIQEINGGSKGA
jgi:2-keto-3-deoxy-L-rhamnonate aldolase RhmA